MIVVKGERGILGRIDYSNALLPLERAVLNHVIWGYPGNVLL